MSVPALTKNSFHCEIVKDRSSFWDNKGNLMMQVSTLSPDNILHWIWSSQIIPSVNVISLSLEDSYQLWHERLRHTSKNALKAASQNLKDVPLLKIPSSTSPCKGCQLGKQTECTYPNSSKFTQRPLTLVHTDLIGPMPVESWDHKHYILTFIDDFSGFALLACLCNKDNAPQSFIKMVKWCKVQTASTLTSVHSDHGGEYMGLALQSFFHTHGVTHQTSAPHTPQQNGCVKRFNHTLLEKVNVM